jgi:diguanylate cyclase (GGDEF)-like protein/PAS domain S-box-containing protein
MFLQKYSVIADQAKNNPDFINIAKNVKEHYQKRENVLYAQVTKQLIDIANMDENIELSYIVLSNADDLITNVNEYEVDANYDLSKREWYINTVKEGKTTVTAPYRDLVTDKMIITIASPIVEEGELYGLFALDILIEDVSTIMSNYKIGYNGYTILAYNNGQILYHPNYDAMVSENSILLQDLLGEPSKELLSGRSGITSYTYQGKEEFIAFIPVRNTSITLLTVIPESDVFQKLNMFIKINLLILAGLVIVITAFLFYLKKLVSNPVIAISQEIDEYSNHNKNISLPQKYLYREDEIGILSRGFTYMVEEISNHILQIEEKNEELSRAKEKMSKERILFKTTLHSLGDAVISTNCNGNVEIMNPMAEKLTGWTNKEAYGLAFDTVFNIINEFTREKCISPMKQVFESGGIVELESHTLLIKKNGEEIPIEDSAAPIYGNKGNIAGVVIVFRDYTEKKEKQDRIEYLSYHDQLTGLYNRRFFEEELTRLDTERNLPFTLAMLDVNGLKLTNDAFGHLMGDELLKTVAEIIKKECSDDAIVARIGGDEFVLLLPKTDYNEAELLIKRIYHGIEYAKLGNIIISVSIGWETKVYKEQNLMDIFAKAEEHMYRKKLIESQSMRNATLQVIITSLNEANDMERIHSEKVSEISRNIGQTMKLGYKMLKELEMAGLLHDIGKIAINSSVLNKPDRLTKLEYLEIKRHSEIGYHILKSVNTYSSISDYVLSHHERWDGKGYPRGLRGKEIPLIARIITVAEAYEVMTADKCYRKALSEEEALKEILNNAGTQFDPEVARLFVEMITNKPSDSIRQEIEE